MNSISSNKSSNLSGKMIIPSNKAISHRGLKIRIKVTDQGGLSTQKSFSLDVLDVNETPTAITARGNRKMARKWVQKPRIWTRIRRKSSNFRQGPENRGLGACGGLEP